MTLTVALREELAHLEGRDPDRRLAEVAAMVDFAGTLQLRGGSSGTSLVVVVRCAQGAVARRLRDTLVTHLGVHPGLARRQGSNLRSADGYLVELTGDPLRRLGVTDDDGRPHRRVVDDHADLTGYLAGAVMVAGSLSGPGSPVHLEVRAPDARRATDLAVHIEGGGVVDSRVVVKAGPAVEAVLDRLGAVATLARFREGRSRRDLRRQVTRSVNADRANLRRATAAAGQQIAAIESVVGAVGWDGLPEDLVGVALARMANPEASLADLGQLVDPPVGKATVHRRLRRLEELAAEQT